MNNDALSDGVKGIKHITPRGYRLGWTPGLPNKLHNKRFSAVHTAKVQLPPKVDLSSKFPYVFDQGQSSSCTANSACYIYGALHGVTKVEDAFSRLFYYWQEREYENAVNEDGGASISDGVLLLSKKGVCREKTWPFDLNKLYDKPSDEAYKEALGFKIRTKTYLDTPDDYKQALAQGNPFTIGISVFSNIDSDRVAKTGLLEMPGPADQIEGGHCVTGVGYDDDFYESEMFKASGLTKEQYPYSKVYIMLNSWGSSWGYKGFFAIPQQYIENNDLSSDGWVIT